ncbi:MAG: hypothetical protein K2X74_10190, partial [Acetobacteraceae bacterium]|nr:hypothetical protein [Acetobacteraceae bacterium]
RAARLKANETLRTVKIASRILRVRPIRGSNLNGPALNGLALSSTAGRSLAGALRWWVSELGSLAGAADRPEPARSDLILQLGPPEAGDALTLIDRRGETPRRYVLASGSDDLSERLAAIRGTGRKVVSIAVMVDPAACFLRTLRLPAAVLPRMRDVLTQELEAATPFRIDAVHADWFVEGEDADGLKVRHVVLKRTRLDPLLATLAAARLVVGPVSVGPSEDRAMPVDLLSGGGRPIPRLLRGFTRSDGMALGLALVLACAAFVLLRAHQDATLAALETATLEARRAAPQRLAPPVQALASALVAERYARPPLAILWSALARALPATAFAESLQIDAEGVRVTLRTRDADTVLRALDAAPNLGTVVVRERDVAGGRLVIGLYVRAWTDPGPAPGLWP